jgi:hypothetical protein
LSFFDEADDEPQPSPRTQSRRPRSAPRSSGGRGNGRPPRNSTQNVQNRRLIAAAVIVVVVILMALLIHGCESSQTTNSLKSYSNNVSALISASTDNGARVFNTLEHSKGATLTNELGIQLRNARDQLSRAEDFSVPGQMSQAQQNLLLAMSQRYDGIHQIDANIASALNKDTSKDGVNALAVGTSLLYSSDVVYKTYVTREIARALHGDDITICPSGSVSSCDDGAVAINGGQIVPSLDWLNPNDIASNLGSQLPQTDFNGTQPGLHGDQINASATTVNGTTLSTAGTTTITQNGPPKFVISVTDGGDFTQDPKCSVAIGNISATSSTGPIHSKGTGSCTVTLPKKVPAGTYTVTVDVGRVPKEQNIQDNSAQYSVEFQ